MSLSPLFNSSWIIVLHAFAAILSVVLGGLQLMMQKGTSIHKTLGYVWVTLMAFVALSSFGIHDIRMIGPFSLIHLLSLLVLYTLWDGVTTIRKGNVASHKKTMRNLYILGLLITGAFTLFPGRIMYQVVFG